MNIQTPTKRKRSRVTGFIHNTRYWCLNGCGKRIEFTGLNPKTRKGIYVCSECGGIFTKKELKPND